jgi:hypothetical protein
MSRVIQIAANAAASSWTDLTSVVRWERSRFGGTAHMCEVGTGAGFDLDDDAGTRSLPAKRVFRVVETATTPDTVLMRGRISDKRLARGQMPVDDAKKFDTTVDDANAQLRGIPVDGWSRPAETGRTRARAALAQFGAGSPRASTNLDYTTYVPNANTVSMPAKRYDQTDLAGVLLECATVEGKQVFVTEDDEVFFDLDTSTAYAASLSITDDNPNLVDEFPPEIPTGQEQGNEFYSGITLKYGTSGSISDVRAGPEADHDYWRTVIQDSDATAATAPSRLATLLNNQSIEEKRYTLDLTLRDTQVDLIRKGQTVSYRSAATGVLTPITVRVASLYWEPVAKSVYVAHLELANPQKLSRRLHSGIPPGAVPGDGALLPPWVCIPTDFTVPWCSGGGGMLSVTATGAPADQSAETVQLYDTARYRFTFVATHATTAVGGQDDLVGAVGAGVFGAAASPTTNPQGTGLRYVFGSEFPAFDDAEYNVVFEATMGANLDPCVPLWILEGAGYAGQNIVGSTLTCVVTYVSGPDPRFVGLPACSNGDPMPGQTVYPEAGTPGDGVTDTGQTNFPFVPNTLEVFVGGPHVVPTETDPTTGAYTLPYPPPQGVTPVLRYVVADTTATGALNGVAASVTEQVPDDVLATNTPTTGEALVWRPGGRVWESLSGVDGALPWYDMKIDGGCVADGVTDDTAAYQAALLEGTANGTRSCRFYHPPGVYLIADALQDTGGFNGQILMPSVSSSDSTILVSLVGPNRPPMQTFGPIPDPNGCAVIKSTLTGASGTASVISGGLPSSGSASRNNVMVEVENLLFVTPDNPTMTCLSLISNQDAVIRGVRINGGGSLGQPTHSNAVGVKLPGEANSNYSVVEGLMVLGYYTGVLLGELSMCQGLIFAFGIVGVEVPFAHHASTIVSMQTTSVAYGIRATGAHYLDVFLYDAEHVASPAWAVTTYDLDDASNYLRGHIRWLNVLAGFGVDHVFNVNGAANMSHVEVGALATGAPASADYLVGTAQGALSGEIVVGATPGGELGGTWGSPTVDATHSGSTHAATQAAAEATAAAALAAHVASTGSAGGDHEHMIDVFSGDASTTVFNLTDEPLDPEAVFAFVAGAWTAVTISGAMNTIATFGSAPGSGTNNVVIQYPAVAA